MKIISTKNFTVSINGHNFVKLLVLKYLSQTLLSYLFFCFKFYIPQRPKHVLYIQVNRKVTQTREIKSKKRLVIQTILEMSITQLLHN